MNETQAAGVLVLMFALRCIAPLLLTLAIGYLMNRLMDRWEAEDTAREPAADSVQLPQPVPASSIRLPTVTVPCWILRNCDEAAQANCPARRHPGIPCWLARLSSEGALPDGCPGCPIYEDAIPAPAV